MIKTKQQRFVEIIVNMKTAVPRDISLNILFVIDIL